MISNKKADRVSPVGSQIVAEGNRLIEFHSQANSKEAIRLLATNTRIGILANRQAYRHVARLGDRGAQACIEARQVLTPILHIWIKDKALLSADRLRQLVSRFFAKYQIHVAIVGAIRVVDKAGDAVAIRCISNTAEHIKGCVGILDDVIT